MQNILAYIQLNDDKIHTRMEVADKSSTVVCHIYVLCSNLGWNIYLNLGHTESYDFWVVGLPGSSTGS